jgi:hypothetical protein
MTMTGGISSKRLQRILIFGFIIFGIVPLALGLLLALTQETGAINPFLTTYYVISILALAVIVFEQLINEIRRNPRLSS